MKPHVFIAALFTFLILDTHALFAQTTTAPSVCEYEETRGDKTPINPKTNKPYTPDERNQEPFDGGSITKDEIKECLQAETPIKNHHIVFEDYRDAWQELAKATGDYVIPLLIEGGVLHARMPYDDADTPYDVDDKGGIRWGEFRDPTINDATKLTVEERERFGIEKADEIIALIRSKILWFSVFIDSAVLVPSVMNKDAKSLYDITSYIFTNISIFEYVHFAGEETSFYEVHFLGKQTSFYGSHFSSIHTDFIRTKFSGDLVTFSKSTFSGKRSIFRDSSFLSKQIYFSEANFSGIEIDFARTKFIGDRIDFIRAHFAGNEVNFTNSTFSGYEVNFSRTSFSSYQTYFREAIFLTEKTYFISTSFSSDKTMFDFSYFSGKEVHFEYALFKSYISFRYALALEKLILDNSNWENEVDFRNMSIKELVWNSSDTPSIVLGRLDFRNTYIGSFILRDVQFQNLVDFSNSVLGYYKFIYSKKIKVKKLLSSYVLFENNTFDNQIDFLYVKFSAPTIFVNNRFQRTLNLTGATFEIQNSQAHNARLCLSFNRISNLIFEPKQLGNPPGISPYQQFMSLFTNPLSTSLIRRIDSPECILSIQSTNNSQSTMPENESLDDIYKTLGKSFREANDREGSNETWYLETLAKRMSQPKALASISWLLGDVPSRYTVDVWRSVWISALIISIFYFIYIILLGGFSFIDQSWHFILWHFNPSKSYHRVGRNRTVQIPLPTQVQRAFRFRLFEPMHETDTQLHRLVIPWWDAAMISTRAFLKLGLGTRYPNSQPLKAFMYLEWAIGVFMLIHFILAVKNNLPFILPFLGVAN